MFCENCGTKLIGKNCNNCFNNSNALKEFEEEND
jgi:hypothetical protein